MTELADLSIEARFAAVASSVDDSDWSDVLGRLDRPNAFANGRPGAARVASRPEAVRAPASRANASHHRHFRGSPLRLALAAAAVALAALVTAVAFGWPSDFVNFLSAPSAPKKVKNSFGAQNVIAPPGMSPQAIPGKARRIMAARFDATGIHPGHGGWHVLYVTPTGRGGFCYEWTHFTGSCFDPNANSPGPSSTAARSVGPLGVTWTADTFPKLIAGYVRSGETKTVEARFANGGSAVIPVTWVSAPINAGFYLYVVPSAHQSTSHAVSAIVALNSNGKVIGRQSFPVGNPLDTEVRRTLPDGTRVSLSFRAEVSSARKIISFTATNGSHVYLWVMDRRGGGRCYVFNQGEGCPPPGALSKAPAFAGGLSIGTKRVLFFAQTAPSVTSIEFRYQDGSRDAVTPTDGFVLHEVIPAHYRLGKRLVTATAQDSRGRVLYRQNFKPRTPGVYPCKTPIARGYGVTSCP